MNCNYNDDLLDDLNDYSLNISSTSSMVILNRFGIP
jgi:post-segregation antitoxin (ccd killing protein)